VTKVGPADGYDEHFNAALAEKFGGICRVVFSLGSKETSDEYSMSAT